VEGAQDPGEDQGEDDLQRDLVTRTEVMPIVCSPSVPAREPLSTASARGRFRM
jgi:hypothetical protein